MKALIIEDHASVAEFIKVCFEMRYPEAHVITATTGSDGMALAGVESPDVVILDVRLPDVSGLEVLGKIRDTSSVPVVMLTGNSGPRDATDSFKSGADAFLNKPFSVDALLAHVEAALARQCGSAA